ncbi:SLAP domain-containing protein [Hathewaya limosa]|uniref:SLAP domain-containing protein n=1 Tax=Hathewaya limosa TaxID=1536 RepID=A0ABU0JQX3_HATLI|nr:SLAP domain-containing protein [Hathewaya limosa]MDQ0479494.1 SLAP domain-containing protein [Hathewaya limosa]
MANLFEKLLKKRNDINNELEKKFDAKDLMYNDVQLNFDYGTSEFKKELVFNEFKNIQRSKINEILEINTVHLYHGFEGTEAGIFITNTSNETIELYKVKLGLMSEYNCLAGDEVIDFKGNVRIQPNSSVYQEVVFKTLNLNQNIKNLKVVFSDLDSLKVYYNKQMDMENLLDPDISENTKEFLRDKFYDIPILREDEFIIDPILALGENDGINLIILFRNGSNKDIVLKSIPIIISMQENLPIYIGAINLNNTEFIVEGNKGKLVNFKIPLESMMVKPIKNYNYKFSIQ